MSPWRYAIIVPFAVVTILGLGRAFATSTPPQDIRVSGKTPWAVILCKFADRDFIEPSKQFYEAVFTQPNAGGVFDYWRDVSNGKIDLSGTVVKGWFRTTLTMADDASPTMTRQQRIDACIDAAKDAFHFPDFHGIVAVYNDRGRDAGSLGQVNKSLNGVSKAYGLFLATQNQDDRSLAFLAHEMGHGYNLPHSFSYSPYNEYGDPWDVMSALNVHSFTGAMCPCGPGLNAHHLDRLGWLPPNRLFEYRGGIVNVDLAPLNDPAKPGSLMVKIPIKDLATSVVRDPYNYYTVEYRRRTRWDAGLPRDGVLIHEIVPDGRSAIVITNERPEKVAGETFEESWGRFSITVSRVDTEGASITIRDLPPLPTAPVSCRPSVGCDGFVNVYCGMIDAVVDLERFYPSAGWVTVSTDNDRWRYHIPFIGTSGPPGDNMSLRVCSVNASGKACTNPFSVSVPADTRCGSGGPPSDPRTRCHRDRFGQVVCPPKLQ